MANLSYSLSADEWNQLESDFEARQAAIDLASGTISDSGTGAVGLKSLTSKACAVIAGELAPTSILDGNSFVDPVPLGAVAITRALMARNCLSFSSHARAASCGNQVFRVIGAYRLTIVSEKDATFIILDIGQSDEIPKLLTVLSELGNIQRLDLPDPIDFVIQVGISKNNQSYSKLLELLNDPVTSIFLY